ncbi:MAG: VOC family protein [Euryarchaeota archaeon]|nr:VOC family protein [Euryarchaeota archaeon]
MAIKNGKVITTIPVTDIKRAKDFYGNRLGLKEVGRVTPGGTHNEVIYKVGENNHVCLYERPEPSGSSATCCSFEVENVEQTVKQLQDNGVKFEEYDMPEMGIKTKNGVASMEDFKVGWFKDPDGNILAVGNSLSLIEKGEVALKH